MTEPSDRTTGAPPPATQAPKPRRPWRDNLEAFGVAILMAVLLKPTIVEAYQIPTSSMQPTLMGSSEAGIYDRILVDKVRYEVFEPRRFDIVVFRYPIRRNQNYVKRIVGMPGDRLRIAGGNLWQVGEDGGIEGVVRKPPDLQEGLWKEVYPGRRELERYAGDEPRILTEYFESQGGSWEERGEELVGEPSSRGNLRLAYTDVAHNGLANQIYDGYAPSIAHAIRQGGGPPEHEGVQDVRFGLTVTPERVPERLVLELSLHPAGHPERELRLQVEGGEGALVIAVDGEEVERSEPFPVPLAPGEPARLRFAHVDDRLRAWVDGEAVAELEVGAHRVTGPLEPKDVRLRLEASGSGEMRVADLRVERDLHYVTTGLEDAVGVLAADGRGPALRHHVIEVPEGHYFMMGDNTLASADSRQWEVVRLGMKDGRVVDPRLAETDPEVVVLEGNERSWDLNARPDVDENPVVVRGARGEPARVAFTDANGEVFALTARLGPNYAPKHLEFEGEHGTWVAPTEHVFFVPREDVLGRPVLTFWPLVAPFRAGFIE